jgi:hypothetical protein
MLAAAIVCAAAVFVSLILLSSGCGDSKSGALTKEQYERIQKDMTLDDVEAIAGQPYRTHRSGPAQNPDIIWYYSKSEADGLLRVSFKGGRVDNISPYDLDVAPEE